MILMVQSFAAFTPSLTATNTFGLGRKRWSSRRQWCLLCLRTLATPLVLNRWFLVAKQSACDKSVSVSNGDDECDVAAHARDRVKLPAHCEKFGTNRVSWNVQSRGKVGVCAQFIDTAVKKVQSNSVKGRIVSAYAHLILHSPYTLPQAGTCSS